MVRVSVYFDEKRQLFSTKTFRSNPLVKGLSWIILESPNHWPLQHTNLIPIHSYPKFSGDNTGISSMAAFLSQVLFKDTSQGRDVTPNGGSAMIQTPMHRGHHLTRNLFHLYRKWIMTMVVGHISEPCRWRNKAQDQMRKILRASSPGCTSCLRCFHLTRCRWEADPLENGEADAPSFYNNPRTDRTANCRASSCSAVVKCQGDIWILRS